jgi:metallophosphoesterase (TIGR00282 family)
MVLRILHIGDIVGSPGRRIFSRLIPKLRQEWNLHAVIANAENAAGGRGLTPPLAEELLAAGADVLTLGDHAWDQKEILPYLDVEPRVIRPVNFAAGCPGRGWAAIDVPQGPRVYALSLIGRVFMPPADCPFRAADSAIQRIRSSLVFAEIHAEATSEKIALGRYLDGRLAALVGTHTHVQTSDETILPNGTAYITDIGMTGPKDSVLGREVDSIIRRFLTGLPTKCEIAENDVALEGALIEVDSISGRASAIRRVRERE